MKKLLYLFLLISLSVSATTVTVKNTGGNVNAGGTYVGGVAPGTTDTVICDGTSGQLTINTTTTVGKINFSGYTGTLTMSAVLTVGGDITLGASMVISGSSGLVQNTTGTITSNAKTWPNVLTLSGTSGTHTLAAKFTVTGLVTVSGATANTLNGDTLLCNGGLTNSTSALSGTTIIYLGGGTWAGTQPVNNSLSFAGNSTLSAGTPVTYGTGTLKYVSGTITTTSNSFTLQSSCTLDCAGMSFNNITLTNASTITINSLLTIGGTFSITGNNQTFAGTSGFTAATLTFSHTGSNIITLANGITYTATTTLNAFMSRNGAQLTITSDHATIKAILTLNQGATCDVLANFTRIDASAGRSILTFNGTVTSCTNVIEKHDYGTIAN